MNTCNETPLSFNEEIKMQELHKRVIEVAAQSESKKRKVGAIIVNETTNTVVAEGFNHVPCGGPCEDKEGATLLDVIHAEDAAIQNFQCLKDYEYTMYVSYPPCADCSAKIIAAGIKEFKVVNDFMKFDASKPRYELVPPIAIKAMAEVITYGAKKYQANNWQTCTDTDRFVGAIYRHIEAWRAGEELDPESGLHHLAHAMTNLAYLLFLKAKTTMWNK